MKKLACISAVVFLLAPSASNHPKPPVIAQGSNKNELMSTMDSLERSSRKLQEGTIRLNESILKIK